MRVFKGLMLAGAALVTTGCLSSMTLVRVQPDGSGTIEQTMLVNMQAIKMMLGGLGVEGTETGGPGRVNESELQQAASRMGDGVRFVSAEPHKQGGFEGARAVFAFDDVTKLQLEPDAISGPAGSMMPSSGRPSPVAFQFTRQPGGTSVLTITLDESDTGGTGDTGGPMDPAAFGDPQMMQMIKSMFAGFRLGIDVEVAGTIVQTNADHVTGSRVTLVELDFEALMNDEAVFKDLQERMGPDLSIGQLRPFLKDVRGLKINEPKVSIAFR
jgi:hypothetical protein